MAAKKKSEDVPPIPAAPDGSSAAEVTAPGIPEAPQVAAGPPPVPAPAVPEVEPRPDPYAAPTTPYGASAAPAAQAAPAQPPYGAPGQPNPYAVTQTYDYATGTYVTTPVLPQGLSLAAMITGIAGAFLSLFAFGFLPALAGVILGHMAQKRQPHARGLWLTGIITGYAGVAISLIWALFTLVPLLLLVIFGVAAGATGSY